MNNDLISREALKKVITANHYLLSARNNSIDYGMFTTGIMQAIDNAPTVEPKQVEWIPVTYRPMTEEEEKELCENFGIKEGSLKDWEKKVFTCRLPDDGQEILTSFGRYVQEDICSYDEYGCGLENNGDWDGIDAWMPKPEPYKKGGEEEL